MIALTIIIIVAMLKAPPIRVKQYRLMSLLYKSPSSFVYTAIEPTTSEKVVVKLIDMSSTPCERFNLETNIITNVDHRYILKAKKGFDDQGFRVIIMPRIMNGDLQTWIKQGKIRTLTQASKIMYRLCVAIEFLHRQHILHGDIKCANVLMTGEDHPLLIDFGFSVVLKENEHCNCKLGTGSHAAPELLMCKPHSYPSDIWSLGVSFFLLLKGQLPFPDESIEYLRIATVTKHPMLFGGLFDDGPPELRILIKSMLAVDPDLRPTAKRILSDPFFVKVLGKEWIAQETFQNSSFCIHKNMIEAKFS